MNIIIHNENEMNLMGVKIGRLLQGGELIDLIGDVGAGKTTLTKGIALGLGITEEVQSPSFTISRTYEARNNLTLVHYDFYRLDDPGIMKDTLKETLDDDNCINVIEWSDIVKEVITGDRIAITFTSIDENTRNLQITIYGKIKHNIFDTLK